MTVVSNIQSPSIPPGLAQFRPDKRKGVDEGEEDKVYMSSDTIWHLTRSEIKQLEYAIPLSTGHKKNESVLLSSLNYHRSKLQTEFLATSIQYFLKVFGLPEK